MTRADHKPRAMAASDTLTPAAPLWRIAPTRDQDGRCLADFMMLIPGLGARSQALQRHVAESVREVCAAYGGKVAFADINYALNVLWVSVAAEPGLGGQVARSIRERVPDAVLVGGHLGTPRELQVSTARAWWRRLRGLPRRTRHLLSR